MNEPVIKKEPSDYCIYVFDADSCYPRVLGVDYILRVKGGFRTVTFARHDLHPETEVIRLANLSRLKPKGLIPRPDLIVISYNREDAGIDTEVEKWIKKQTGVTCIKVPGGPQKLGETINEQVETIEQSGSLLKKVKLILSC